MQLTLRQILPVPLRDRLQQRASDIWQRDLSWGAGMRLFVKAPSGTGKTTLIHILYGLRKDYTGQVLWERQQTDDAEAMARLRREPVSVVFQDLRLFPDLTAWENLELKRRMTGTVAEAAVLGWMERLGIAGRKDAPGKTLSYGEQQRVAIIRSLLQPFRWLLMDEPFSHLDRANTEKAAALISEVVAERDASFLLADLDDNDHFPYTQTLML